MPISYTLDDSNRVVWVVGDGDADVRHCEEVIHRLAVDLELRHGWPIVCDFQRLHSVPTPGEVRQIAAILRELRTAFTGPIALAVANPVTFGMARILSALVEPFGILLRPFRSRIDAETWSQEAAHPS